MVSWTKFTQKEYLVKTGKKWKTYQFCIFQISGSKLQLQGENFPQKAISSKNRKSEQHHFKLVLVANFSLNWRFFFFWTKFDQKSISNLNQKKMNTIIKFCIFKSVYILNFSLNWQFNFFDKIFPTKYFQSKTEKVDITNEFYIFESVLATNFS